MFEAHISGSGYSQRSTGSATNAKTSVAKTLAWPDSPSAENDSEPFPSAQPLAMSADPFRVLAH